METYINQLKGIKALDLLFYNYSQEQLNEMLQIKDFQNIWNNYLDENQQTHPQLWDWFNYKMNIETKLALLEMADKYYGIEAKKGIDFALKIKRAFNKIGK